MIFNLLINFVLLIFGAIFVFLPEVTIETIPYIGPIVSVTLTWIVGLWNSLVLTLPYLDVPMRVFLYVIIPFELMLIILKFFLHNRISVATSTIK